MTQPIQAAKRTAADASAQPPRGAAAPGTIIEGRYRVESLVGWGGQALVYRAADLRSNATVALKVVRGDLARADLDAAVAALAWEGRLLQRLRHTALPKVVQLRQTAQIAFIARELVVGRTLAEVARGKPCDPQLVLSWALQMCDLLTFLHTRRPPVICGDLKPRNLVLRPNGQLVLIDMGAAQTLTRQPPRTPRPRHGTPGYAAPEQLGAWGGDERSDLFSLAVTCYELLTGLDPTSAPLQFDWQELDRHARSYTTPLRWALELSQGARPPTAAALRAALGAGAAARPLVLTPSLRIDTTDDLVRAAGKHSFLLEAALLGGAVETWLANHPDAAVGRLLHELRAALKRNGRRRKTDALLEILTPPQGSPDIEFWPSEVAFGEVPLRRWRSWLRGKRLTLRNTASTPLRWSLECDASSSAEVRILVDGRAQRSSSGTLLPAEGIDLELVAMGKAGAHVGNLTLRCGAYVASIPWSAEGKAGLPLGTRVVPRFEDLDPRQNDIVPLLEDLLARGVLERWLDAQGQEMLAQTIRAARVGGTPPPLALRLLAGDVLHARDPWLFPRLKVALTPWAGQPLTVGRSGQTTITVENSGTTPCMLTWSSQCAWASVTGRPIELQPGQRIAQMVVLEPPRELPAGNHSVALELHAANLVLPLTLEIPVVSPRWWQQVVGWLTG